MKNKFNYYLTAIFVIFFIVNFFIVDVLAVDDPKEVLGDEPKISEFETYGFELYKSESFEIIKDKYFDAKIEYRLPIESSEMGGRIWVNVGYVEGDDFEQMAQVEDIADDIEWAKEQKDDYYNFSISDNFALKSREASSNIEGEIYYLRKPIMADVDFNVPKENFDNFLSVIINYFDSLVEKSAGSISSTTETEQLDDSEEYSIQGKMVFDKDGLVQHQAENMKVFLNIFNENGEQLDQIELNTTHEGEFSVDFPYPVDQGYKVVVSTSLMYFDDTDQAVFYVTDDNTAMDEVVMIYCGEYTINSSSDLDIVSSLYESQAFEETTEAGTSSNTYVYFYQSMKEAVDYYKDVFNFEFDSRLPLKLILNETDTETASATGYYVSETSQIHIMENYSNITSSAMPYTIYHELSHYVMTMLYYPDYPGDSGIDTDTHHGGYANSYTGYSYSEGFAIFMENIIAMHYYDEFSNIMGNPELNHKVWENYGFSETIAVASLLYDFIDAGEEDDDQVSINDLFAILREKQRHCADLYDALQHNHPEISDAIDQVFIDHGFFAVTDVLEEGAGVHNVGEAFVDLNDNFMYDEGEPFVDYNAKDQNGIYYQEYRDTYIIGNSANANNPDRYRTFLLPGHFVKIDTNSDRYQINYYFPDTPNLNYSIVSDVIDGYIYIQNPPLQYYSEITFVSHENGEDSTTHSFTSSEFYKNYSQAVQQGYFMSYSEPEISENSIVDSQDTESLDDSKIEYDEDYSHGLSWITITLIAFIVIIFATAIFLIKGRFTK